MFGQRGAEQLGSIAIIITTATTCRGGLYCVGEMTVND